MISFKQFDPKNAEKDWNNLLIWRKIYHQENRPNDPMLPEDKFKILITHQLMDPEIYGSLYLIKNELDVVGMFFYMHFKESNPSYKGNEKLLMFQIQLLDKFKRKGIASKALRVIAKEASKFNKSSLICSTDVPDSKFFFDAIGAKIALDGRENRLYFRDVNWNMVEDWVQDGKSKNQNSKLNIYDNIPQDILSEFSEVYTETLNQQPFGDLEISDMVFTPERIQKREKEDKEAGLHRYTAITFEENGKIAGLSELIFVPGRDTMVSQGLTGVKMEYRGRKFGKWVKAALLLFIKDKYETVEFITTDNAESNEAMLYINSTLGFKKHKESWMANLSLENLNKYLNSKKLEIMPTVV